MEGKAAKKSTKNAKATANDAGLNRQKKQKKMKKPAVPVAEEEESGEDEPAKKPPGQPTVSVVDMQHILRPLAFRRHTEWTVEEKDALAKFMCNRAGIDASDKAAMHREGLTAMFNFWFDEYVRLYETDREFERAIDPWQVIFLERPPEDVFLALLDLGNQHIGGVGAANAPNEPVQFMHGKPWILSIPSGKEDARRVVSFIKGHCLGQNLPLEAIVQDYRASIKDA